MNQTHAATGAARSALPQSEQDVQLLHKLIERQVALAPQHEALRFEGRSLTYAELDRRANQCAHYLRELGVGPDTLVGVYMARSLELVVALLAILKAGGAYLPLDTGHPVARLRFLLEDADVPVVLTLQCHAERLDAFAATVLRMDAQADHLAGYSGRTPELVNQPSDLAYVIYTSGSTGQPKGCLLSHTAICNRLLWMQDEYGLRPEDRVLQKTPYTFDVSVWELFWPLLAGATLVLAAPQGHKDSHYLAELIRVEGITMCHFVPSMLRFFLNDPGAASCLSLRDAFTSGEALPFDLVRQFKALLPARLHNLYGPTEAAVDVSSWVCEVRPDRKVPIGRAIRNIRLYILDAERRPVPPGNEGELYIAGVGLARGYLRRPQLTAECFVDDPFVPGEKMYRTGDRAIELDDGNIDFRGRIDFQVKLRGLRIELGEIESLLRLYDGVREAAVLVRDEDEGDPKLVAYLEVPSGQTVDTSQVRRFVAEQLPEYMVPNRVLALPQLPTTTHGKLDRAALPWPLPVGGLAAVAPALTASAESVLQPESLTEPSSESQVCAADAVLAEIGAIVTSVLKRDHIADDADLFDLGATSLTLVRVVEKIRAAFDVAVPLDVFLDSPTVASIAVYVAKLASARPRATTHAGAPPEGKCVAVADRSSHVPLVTELSLPPIAYRSDACLSECSSINFSGAPVGLEHVGAWLGCLRASGDGEGSDPKYLYASGGGLNPVRTYVWVSDDGVPGLPGGAYYYHPMGHALHRVGETPLLADALPGTDAPRLANAAFAVYLITEMAAVEPLYREASAALAVLEAGYMSQLLLEESHAHGLVAAASTGFDPDALIELFALAPTERFVHGLLVGVPSQGMGPVLPESGMAFASHACVRHEVADAVFGGQSAQLSISPEQLKLERRQLRVVTPATPSRPLKHTDFAWTRHRLRASCREYAPQEAGLDQLAGLLGMARRQFETGERQYLYGVAGLPRDLTIYVYLRGGTVPEGVYHYDPLRHRLVATGSLSTAQLELAYTPYNRRHFKQGSFCLFLFGRSDAAVGRQVALHAALLDAGSLGQLFMERQAEFGLGLCPIGAMRFERIRQAFVLDAGLELLHSFIGGVAYREVPADWPRIAVADIATMQVPSPVSVQPTGAENIAIVGLSGRYPGARNTQEFWRNLQAGVCSIGAFPETRLGDACGVALPAGGYLPDIASFDSLLFGIAPVEARGLDPQERLLLEEVWACLEEAGYTADSLAASCRRIGVFVGAMWNDYQSVGLDSWRETGRAEEFSHHASLANRISHVFDFSGPSVAVNTSCASSLTALHLAVQSLRLGECDAAIVGGVNVLAHPYHARLLADLGMLSKDGQPRPLSAEASGWAPGEGAGAVLLKLARHAERDSDHVHALVRASHIGHSGRSSRYGAPHVKRQVEHLRQLLANAGLVPGDIDCIEATAPGASLADAAEMTALNEVFGTSERLMPCYVGTVKGNIGHLESASGLSQLTKMVMQLGLGRLAPTLGSEPRSPLIELDGRRLAVVTDLTPLPGRADSGVRRPRHALIDSIGAAGSCGYLVVAEYVPTLRGVLASELRQPVLLSAATADQLRQQIERLHDFLIHNRPTDLSFGDLAFTLRVGRVAMSQRLAFVAGSLAELVECLGQLIEAGVVPPGVHAGVVPDGAIDTPSTPVSGSDPQRLAEAWVQGRLVDWRAFECLGQRRVSLPTYPFEAVRHWLDAGPALAQVSPAVAACIGPEPDARGAELQERTHAYLMQRLAEATGIPLARMGIERHLEALGLNSMVIQTLNARLAPDLPGLPSTLFFEHRTLRSLATYLLRAHRPALRTLFGLQDSQRAQVLGLVTKKEAPANAGQDIAIIGLAGRYPQAETLEAFWRHIADGHDCIQPVPASRWDGSRVAADGQTPLCPWGGFLDGVDAFDPLFFNISPIEAERMDPQERLMLQTAWQVIEDAGHSRSMLEDRYRNSVGVFVGVMYSEYQLLAGSTQALGITGSFGTIPNRVSYVLNLNGPSMAVDTMCSSSLTAVHLACESIRRGECACAIAGGVNLSLHPNKYITHALLNMPSSDGRCRSFGEGGDGFVPGEGVGAVMLKPLAQAVADGDPIYGVIKASSVNHGGKTNGYTVPNPDAQQALVAQALHRAGVNAREVSYVEAHGTGTALGDPIEIAGLSRAFSEYTADRQFCAIGSVKSNIGHAEAAAGIAGLTKVLLQMRHGQLAPSLHASQPNPNIDFADTPFFVQQELAEWRRPVIERDGGRTELPRMAGISSFGAGGGNAHLIVAEHRLASAPPAVTLSIAQPVLVVLSAKNADRLRERVRQLLAVIDEGRLADAQLADAAYTLQVGRDPMDVRLALAVSSVAALRERLLRVLDAERLGDGAVAGVYYGEVRRCREEVAELEAGGNAAGNLSDRAALGEPDELLRWWVKGLAVDWDRLYGTHRPCRVSLPTYPFASERCWIPEPSSEPSRGGVPVEKSVRLFDRAFFEKLFRDLDSDRLSVDAALAQARRRI